MPVRTPGQKTFVGAAALVVVFALDGSAAGPGAAALQAAKSDRAAKAKATGGVRPHLTKAAEALETGRYERVLELLGAARRSDETVLAARAELALGRAEVARRRLEAAAAREPENLSIRHVLIDCLDELGDRPAVGSLVDRTYDDWRARRVDRARAADLMAVAAAVRHDNNWQDANDILREATRAEPDNARPNVMWGDIFLEKHNAPEAEASYRAALADDPDSADARVGLARALLQTRYDVAAAEQELAAALHRNPRHAGALAVRGELALDAEDFPGAARVVDQLRRTNPRSAHAAALAAARAFLLDAGDDFQRERRARAAVNPSDGAFFATVADVLVRHRRYEDARDLADECLGVDAENARCLSILGTTLLRLGVEAQGLETLRRAWKRDPYDVRTFNLLELFDKVIPGYELLETKHLRFRVAPRSRKAVELVVAPFLEETYEVYARRYGIEPGSKVTIELYEDPRHYAVRTVGLPGLDVAAVCFGPLITARAPGPDGGNWGMVLSHELAHVFAIALSRSRVPRWFTEGLSELEAGRLRPEWRRHQDRKLWGAAKRGELPSLAQLSAAFVRARNGEEMSRAYAQAAAAIGYLEKRAGFGPLREALVRFGRGERGLAVVAATSGIPADELDAGFRAAMAARWARFEGQYAPSELLRGARDDAERAVAVATERSRPEALARLGLAQLAGGDAAAARRTLAAGQRAAGQAATAPLLFLAGELALAERRADEAQRAFAALLALPRSEAGDPAGHDAGTSDGHHGHDGYDVRVRLALAEIHRRNLGAAEQHLRRALTFDPESVEAHGLLLELLGDATWAAARKADRLRAAAATVTLEPLHRDLAKDAVAEAQSRGAPAPLAEAARLAIFIDPAAPELHAALGRALLALDKPAEALPALERALALGRDTDAPPIRGLIAEARARLGRPRPGHPP